VGTRFSEKQFQSALKLGKVDSVTVFAKCHHSWSYYPTKVGRVHPTLKTDLLGRQIEACHEIGVRAPIYYTVGWSANDAEWHPEWVARDEKGEFQTGALDLKAKPEDPRPVCSWKFLCPGTGYGQHIVEQVTEICEMYPVDGFFFDICMMRACYCADCTRGMKEEGIDLKDEAKVTAYSQRKWATFFRACRGPILAKYPEATVFFNGVADSGSPEEVHACQTHFELEDLPTTWGGYDKFPPRARYFARKGKPMLAMSGKFHTMWGEFGGFKHPDAIKFEAAGMVAYGAACSFGDQLHPSGEADPATWRNIGIAYDYVRKIEEFGVGGKPLASLAILETRSPQMKTEHGAGTVGDEQGVANMLMESGVDFEYADLESDLSQYETIVLSGPRFLDGELAELLSGYVRKGGSILALGDSPVSRVGDETLLDVGSTYVGPGRFDVDYTVVSRGMKWEGGVETPFLNYTSASRFRPEKLGKKATVLGAIREPYFSRTYGRYCSHQNTPYELHDSEHVAGTQVGRVVHLAHRLGLMYYQHGARVHRELFTAALRRIHKRSRVKVEGLPSAGRVSLLQLEGGGYALHLLYGPPLQRGRCLVIEDLPEIRGVRAELRLPKGVKRAWDVVSGKRVKLSRSSGKSVVVAEVPAFRGHVVIGLE
jgi:hypothetical protein